MNEPVNTREEHRQIVRVTWCGLICNLALSAVKVTVGLLAGSQALVADGIHSLSDLSSDVAILLGEKFWLAPADENHPYGHRRIEALITVLIGLLLAAAAIGIGWDALFTLHVQNNRAPGWTACYVALASIVIKELLYRYTFRVGTRIRSSAVKANALHHRADAFSSIPVALAVLVSILIPQWSFVDHVGALVVTCFILHSAWVVMNPALQELSDRGACQKTRDHLREKALTTTGVKDIHALRTRRSGSGFLVDLHVLVDPTLSVLEGHAIAGKVKSRLLENQDIIDVLVHIEPLEEAGEHSTKTEKA
ncbi:MAG: cation diffusion facilitator family transporter [Kiritimatiellae bacterium]|nr:cation diffusion facilitator family transporter [Kiritimatiellia bacterium]MDD4736816.1 cation diffusion facilitator family transporter [Kiritimatiellia bacterium]